MSMETFDYVLMNIQPELEKKVIANRILSAAKKLFLQTNKHFYKFKKQ